MADSSALSDGAQQANLVSNENAETMFGADQAETNMVKLVDGKLTPIGDTHDDVMDEQLRNRYSSDEERSLQGDQQRSKTYENSDAALRAGNGMDSERIPQDAYAEAEITGNPDAGATVETGLPSEAGQRPTDTAYQPQSHERPNVGQDAQTGGRFENVSAATKRTHNDPDQAHSQPSSVTDNPGAAEAGEHNVALHAQPANGDDLTNTFGISGMIPQPGENPIPSTPDAPIPPTPPAPGPEFPPMPGQPMTPNPDIQEPSEPGRSHEINASDSNRASVTYQQPYGYYGLGGFVTRTATLDYEMEPGEAVPGNQYEGMGEDPDTGDSAQPYDVSAKDADPYQPGERPQEAKQMEDQPRAAMDESSQKKADMDDTTGSNSADPSEMKSTEGLDRKYNDSDTRGVI